VEIKAVDAIENKCNEAKENMDRAAERGTVTLPIT
jgi:hypothetical protein